MRYVNVVLFSLKISYRHINEHHSVATSCPNGRKLYTVKTTTVCSLSSTNTILLASSGVKAVLRAMSGLRDMTGDFVSRRGLRAIIVWVSQNVIV